MANILYIAQFFSTESEPGGQGQRHYKHALSLAEDGHHVTVLTGGSTTMNMVQQNHQEFAQGYPLLHPNLTLVKIPTSPLIKRSVLNRALRYFAFSFKALIHGLQLLLLKRRNFQFVIGSSPPLLIGMVAWILSVVSRADLLLEVRDLWSQTMAANGFISNPLAIALNRTMESFLYRQSRKIIVVSRAFTDEIDAQVPGSADKTVFIPNGADLEFFQYPKLWKGSFLREEAESRDLFHVVYAGVFSDYTRLESLLDAARLLRDAHPQIRFNLAGGGYQVDRLKSYAADLGLTNVAFWETLPKNRISKFIMEGDLSIINYRALDIFGQVLPNKLFDYLAAGRPILAGVPQGEISRILEESGCGFAIQPENPEQMVEKILWFYQNQEAGLKMGRLGQYYVRSHYNRTKLVDTFLGLFPRIISIDPASRRSKRTSGRKVVPISIHAR